MPKPMEIPHFNWGVGDNYDSKGEALRIALDHVNAAIAIMSEFNEDVVVARARLELRKTLYWIERAQKLHKKARQDEQVPLWEVMDLKSV